VLLIKKDVNSSGGSAVQVVESEVIEEVKEEVENRKRKAEEEA
jgi:ribosome-associated protein YbcJ (S4-like RNA binding protein)